MATPACNYDFAMATSNLMNMKFISFHRLNCQLTTASLVFLVCGSVGVADRNIMPDARMTASTSFRSDYSPYYGRLNETRGRGVWCPKTPSDKTDYLQVDMGVVHAVCAVATMGERTDDDWTTSYKLDFSLDGETWNTYRKITSKR